MQLSDYLEAHRIGGINTAILKDALDNGREIKAHQLSKSNLILQANKGCSDEAMSYDNTVLSCVCKYYTERTDNMPTEGDKKKTSNIQMFCFNVRESMNLPQFSDCVRCHRHCLGAYEDGTLHRLKESTPSTNGGKKRRRR